MCRFLIFLFSLIAYSTFAQDSKPEFKNQGAQEDYWAKELFATKYATQRHDRYKGPIKANGSFYSYGSKVVNVGATPGLEAIFSTGMFYPGLLSFDSTMGKSDSILVSNFEEAQFLSPDPKRKRFRFWVFRKGVANPRVYFMELTNPKAKAGTSMATFIKGAALTFFAQGWTII